MAVTVSNQIAPLLGNFQPVTNDPQTGAARIVRGVSDPAADLLGLSRRSSVGVALVESNSPTASDVKTAIGGYFSYARSVRDAADNLAKKIDQSYNSGQFTADTLVSYASSLVTAINNLRTFISNSSSTLSAALLTNVNSGTDNTQLKANLAQIGITISSDGTVSLDSSVLRQAIAADKNLVANTLGRTAGLAIRELDLASTIISSAAVSVEGFSGGGTTQSMLLTSAQLERTRLTGQFVDLQL